MHYTIFNTPVIKLFLRGVSLFFFKSTRLEENRAFTQTGKVCYCFCTTHIQLGRILWSYRGIRV